MTRRALALGTSDGLPEGALGELWSHVLRYLPSRVVPGLLGLVTVPLVARGLGPAGFGSFSLITVSVPYVMAVAADWVIAAYQRDAHTPCRGTERQAATWVVVLGVGSTAVLMPIAALLEAQELLAVAALLLPSLLTRLQWTKLQMEERSATYSLLQVVYSVTRSVGIVAASLVFHSILAVVVAWVAALALTAIVGPRLSLSPRATRSHLFAAARFGVPLVVVSFGLNVMATADRYILAGLGGRSEVGVYSFGYTLAEGSVALLASLPYLAIYPAVARLWDGTEQVGALRLLERVVRVQLVVMMALGSAVAVVGPAVLRFLAPPGFGGAARVFVIISLAQVFLSMTQYAALRANLERRTGQLARLVGLVGVANVALTVFAVAVSGTLGAAVATFVTYAGYAALTVLKVWPGLFARREVFRIVVAAGLVLMHVFVLHPAVGPGRPSLVLGTLLIAAVVLVIYPVGPGARINRAG